MPNCLDALRESPYARFYNLDGLKEVFLTADVDWAPDYAIEEVLKEVEARGMKMTMFATGDSAVLKAPPSWLEVGLHPDFTRKNGPWHDERMATLKALYPQAVGMRSHRNFFGQNIADLAKANGLSYDASVIQFNHTLIQASCDYNGMTRFAYCWEDGIHLDMNYGLETSMLTLEAPGMKIINVHPVLMYLNSENDDHRRGVTRRYADLASAQRHELESDRNTQRGIADVWKGMLDDFAARGVRTHCLCEAVL